jgi:DNA-binding GntR family transcriptional regulator
MSRNKQGKLERRSQQKQIADYYASLIDGGQIKAGDKVPGRSEIADTWSVGVMVAQAALEILRDTGYVVTIQRRGSYATAGGEEGATASAGG